MFPIKFDRIFQVVVLALLVVLCFGRFDCRRVKTSTIRYPFRLAHQLNLTQLRTLVQVDSVGVGFDSTGKVPLYIPVVTATDTIKGDSIQPITAKAGK